MHQLGTVQAERERASFVLSLGASGEEWRFHLHVHTAVMVAVPGDDGPESERALGGTESRRFAEEAGYAIPDIEPVGGAKKRQGRCPFAFLRRTFSVHHNHLRAWYTLFLFFCQPDAKEKPAAIERCGRGDHRQVGNTASRMVSSLGSGVSGGTGCPA